MTADVTSQTSVKPSPAPAPKKGGWFAQLKPYLAPILISCILAAGSYKRRKYGRHDRNELVHGFALAGRRASTIRRR